MRIVIGIPTFRRPSSLATTLESLTGQGPLDGVEVLVVDNDPEGTALSVVREFEGRLSLSYLLEPQRGVAHARNKIVESSSRADYLIFIDDDQVADVGWLAALKLGLQKYPDEILTGPVNYHVGEGSKDELIVRKVFLRPSHPDGSLIRSTGTGNTLIPQSAWSRVTEPKFDLSFSTCGGEDTELFWRLTKAGCRIRWCEQARVCEYLAGGRGTLKDARRRSMKAGFVNGRLAMRESHPMLVGLGGVARIIVGGLQRASLVEETRADGEIRMYGGIGRARAAIGYGVSYYPT